MLDQTFLFNASSSQEEDHNRDFLDRLTSVADRVLTTDDQAVVHLDVQMAVLVAWIIDIGSAPRSNTLAPTLRRCAILHGAAVMNIGPDAACQLRDLISAGVARHEAGVTDPSTFRIH